MIEGGEDDAELSITAYGTEAPPWKKNIPLVALASPQTAFVREPQVRVEVGCPGIDHGGAEFSRETASIVGRLASHRSPAPSVAAIIGEIAKHLGEDASC
jgi:formylmethanofuran dehydrogenase subunit B